jgi:hypothetical protein
LRFYRFIVPCTCTLFGDESTSRVPAHVTLVRAVCYCDNPTHTAKANISINRYRLGEGVGRTRGLIRRSAKDAGYGNVYSKALRTGFFRRRSILRTSTAIPCRPSGCDPPSACVASRLAPKKNSRFTWLVDCQRTPLHGDASRLSATTSNACRQPRSARSLLAAKTLQRYMSRPWT